MAGTADLFAQVDAISRWAIRRRPGSGADLGDRNSTRRLPALALRAGLGATTIAADPMGRVLVTDTRGGQLLVFGVDPLMEQQAYPVGAPAGWPDPETLVCFAGQKPTPWIPVEGALSDRAATGLPLAFGKHHRHPVRGVRYQRCAGDRDAGGSR